MTDNGEIGLWARLRQHRFYRVVTIYAIVAWVLIQLTNILSPNIDLAHRMLPALIVVLLSGFPLAVVLAWVLIKPGDPTQFNRWQRLHWKLGATLSAAAVIFVVLSGGYTWKFSERHAQRLVVAQATAKPVAAPNFNPPNNSLAVLPFENLNGDAKQQYFSDGITQELTDALGQIPALRVIAWGTASTFRDPKLTATGIGKALNVANLVHGSILHQGDQVRVTVELVNTVTGYQVWAARYDRPFKDVLQIQDAISQAIAATLQVEFAHVDLSAGTTNPEAHELVFRGWALLDQTDAASYQTAQRDFEQAIKLDPDYADAHALLAGVEIGLTEVTTLPLKEALPKARAEAYKALSLDARNVDALIALGIADAMDNRIAQAREEYRRALALDPSNAAAHVDYALILPLNQAVAQEQEALLLDPKDVVAQYNFMVDRMDLGDYAQAVSATLAMIRLDPHSIDAAFLLAFAYRQLHQDQAMVGAFDLVQPATPQAGQLLEAGQLVYQSVLNPALRSKALAAVANLRRRKLSPDLENNILQLYLVLGNKETALRMLQNECVHDPIGCDDLAINPLYQTLRGDARFERLAVKYTTRALQ